MNRVLRGPFRQLAVQVALGSLVVALLVGAAVVVQLDAYLEGGEEERYAEQLGRQKHQLLDQIGIYQDLTLIATIWIASMPDVASALESGDVDDAIAAINAAFAPFGLDAETPPLICLYALDGSPLGSTFSGDASPAPADLVERIASGRTVRSVRDVPGLGLSFVSAAPIYNADRTPVGIIESITVIDSQFIEGYTTLLGSQIAVAHAGRTIASSPSGFDPLRSGPVLLASADYVVVDEGRYLADAITMRLGGGAPEVEFYLGVPAEDVRAAVAGVRAQVLPLFGAGALMAVVLSFGVAWLTSRHMGELAAAARRIQRNDLDRPVPVAGAGEIRELAEAMEGMRAAIQQGRAALLASNSDLAVRFDTSTANLAEVTHELSVMHGVLAQLDGESPGGVAGVAEALVELEWVDGVVIALVEEAGRLRPAGTAGLAPGAAGALTETLSGESSEQTMEEGLYVASVAGSHDFAHLTQRGIGGLAVQAMATPEGVAGFVAVTAERRLTLTPQREDLLRSVAREVAMTLERTELASEVEENRRIADSVLREMSDGVLVLDHEQTCRIANPAAARLLGRSRTDLVGKPATAYLPVSYRALEALRRRHSSDSDTGPVVVELEGRQVAISVGRFSDPDPDRAGLIVMLRDLSAEAEAERVKQDFVSMVGHELRTPLTLIRTTIDLLHEGDAGELNETQERIVGVLRNNSERLMALISDLLDMSALDAGRMHIQPDWMELGAAVAAATNAQRGPAETKQHTLTVDAPDEVTVWADRSRVEQIVANLVSNAIKYTPPGGTIEVTVAAPAAAAEGEMASVTVRDDGMGVAPGDQERLFEKFYRTPEGQRTTGGTGLGLSITRSLVELHGGTIRVESDGQSGSAFTFTLPTRRV